MDSLRNNKFIVFFIYLTIFVNSYVFFTEPFEFYFGYFVYLILLPVFISKHMYPKQLVNIFSILLITGIFNIMLNNNTSILFFKVFTGLVLSYIFYYYVITEFKFNIEQLFKWYLRGCYWVSWIGIIQLVSFLVKFKPGYDFTWILNKWSIADGGFFGMRVNSVFSEPTYLATVISGAFFVSLYNLTRRETYYYSRFQSLVIISVYFVSFSGVGQLGIFLTLLFLAISYGLVRYIVVIVPMVIVLFSFLYNNVTEFRDRYDSLTGLFQGEKFEIGKTHGSSFILYNNFIVTMENFKGNFIFGGGVGSHPVAFDKYSLAKNIKIFGFNSNSADANSMLLRLVSETGLFGTCIFLFIVFKCYVRRNEDYESYHWLISNAIIVLILLNLFRQGHYFLNGFPFFMMLYYYNYMSHETFLETGKDMYTLQIEEEMAETTVPLIEKIPEKKSSA